MLRIFILASHNFITWKPTGFIYDKVFHTLCGYRNHVYILYHSQTTGFLDSTMACRLFKR